MRIDVLTLFPRIVEAPLEETILGRAREAGLLDIAIHDLRKWGIGRHRSVDDYPFGGGPGMVMRPEPLFAAVESIQPLVEPVAEVVLLTPQGRPLDAPLAAELAELPRLLLVCGRYEGVDERVRERLVNREVSVADVVLSGGAPAERAVERHPLLAVIGFLIRYPLPLPIPNRIAPPPL